MNTQKGNVIQSSGLKVTEWRNQVILADCLDAIDMLAESMKGMIRLIYVDPPFFSNVDYSIKTRGIASVEQAAKVVDKHSYSDKWEGGLDEYLSFMRVRLEKMRGLLTQDGSLWVHLDYHVSHYIKTILDDIFGYANFVNEIIWKRTNSPKSQSRGFGCQHDVILLYANDCTQFKTNPIYRPHDKKSKKPYSYEDEKGRFRLIEIEAQGIQKTQGRKIYDWRGRSAPYLYSKERLEEWWEQGLIYKSKNGRYTKKQYLADVKGLPVSDLWLDIPPVQGSSNEFTGFITQKPIALMKRVIESASMPGDIVSDFFVGSGTLAIAATDTKRRWIVCDESDLAIKLLESRLSDISHDEFDVISLKK
ncbi:MAG: site-specific DNA-methyltransferase [Candidatus Thorarchaeota archaeon]